MRHLLCAAGMGLLLAGGAASAAELEVGQGKTYQKPSEAIKAAQSGDVIRIDGGEYFDCALVRADHLLIEGVEGGEPAVMTDSACAGKAILIAVGNDITIRNLTLARARVPYGNGAGIRGEGKNLTIDKVRFVNNQMGILANADGSAILVKDSQFVDNGANERSEVLHAIGIGRAASLHVEGSRFVGTRGFSDVKSGAAVTELVGNSFEGGEKSTASYMVEATEGGSVLLRDNHFTIAAKQAGLKAAILLGADGDQPVGKLAIAGNSVENQSGQSIPFVRNMSGESVLMNDNKLSGMSTDITSSGSLKHRIGNLVRSLKDGVRHLLGQIRHAVSR